MDKPEMNAPLCDVFATQGILIVLICMSVFVLHLCVPAFCYELLTEWRRIAEESPELAILALDVKEWFASICSG